MDKVDYKKTDKTFYQPKTTPSIVDVPEMVFITVAGKGNPNDEAGEYSKALQLLYALSYAIKMSKMGNEQPEGYFEYVVPPLEGLWWIEGLKGMDYSKKDNFNWISMIRQPDFVTQDVLDWACAKAAMKNPDLDYQKAQLQRLTEGLCVQCMHIGPYDDEPATVAKMDQFMKENGYVHDFSDTRRHHEIYLGDPRKTAPERLKTVIRHPIKKIN